MGEEIVYDFLKIKDDADLLASLFNTDGDTILAWWFLKIDLVGYCYEKIFDFWKFER